MVTIHTSGEKVFRDSGMKFKPTLLILSCIFIRLKKGKLQISMQSDLLLNGDTAGSKYSKKLKIILFLYHQIVPNLKLLIGPSHRRYWDTPHTVSLCVSREQELRVTDRGLLWAILLQYLANSGINNTWTFQGYKGTAGSITAVISKYTIIFLKRVFL